jgi:O-antigen/teichoic acid export membrane protein
MASDHATARHVALGTAANIAGQALVILSIIVVTPLVVHAVGPSAYGVWVLFGSIASFGLLLELGIAAALVKYVAEHAARGEQGEAARMVGAATWLYALAGGLLAITGIALAFVVPALADLHGTLGRYFTPLAILVGLNLGVSMLAISPVALLQGLQRFPAANAIISGGAVLAAILTIVALALDTGIVGVAAGTLMASTVTYLASLALVRRLAPAFLAIPVLRDRRRARRLLRFSRSVAVIQVAIRLQSRLDAVVIAAALPIRLIAPYNFGLTLENGISTVTEQFSQVLLPMATEAGVTREENALPRLFLTSTRLTMAIAFAVGMPVALLGGPILGLWIGHAYAGYGTVVALLAVAAMVDLPSLPAAALLQSVERHGPIAWMALASGVTNLALSIALVGPFGIEGVAAGTLIASGVEIALLVVPYAARVLGVSPREFCSEVLLRVAPALALLAGLLLLGRALVPVTTLPRLLLVVGVALLGYTLLYTLLGAPRSEREVYRAALAAALRLPMRLRGRRSSTTGPLP